ncbi:MAG: hypothetical protein WDZ40_00770 [Candidatus Spechtbacterales bacterium]
MEDKKESPRFRVDPKTPKNKELEDARNKTGLWTTHNIQFKTLKSSGGNFKGVRKKYQSQNRFVRFIRRTKHKISTKLKSAQ